MTPHQQIAEGDDRSGLPRPGRHHHQCLAVTVTFEGLADSPDAARLIVPLDDCLVDCGLGEHFSAGTPLDEKFQLFLLVESLHLSGRVVRVVPQPVVIAVGVEDHRPPAEPRLQTVGVELRLLLADPRVPLGALGFHQGERLAVVSPEDVIDESLPLGVGHAADLELPVLGRSECPARFPKQEVNEMIACFRFGIVVGVRLGKTGFSDRGHLGPQAFKLLVQQGLVGKKRREFFISFMEFGFQPLQLIEGLPGDGRKFSKRGRIKDQFR